MKINDIKDLLDQKAIQYNVPEFIETDPVQIPRSFTLKEDIEIAAFLSATIAWGNRASVINNARRMMAIMGNSPYDFIMSHSDANLDRAEGFVHRTFNAGDFRTFIKGLQHIYTNHHGMEQIFTNNQTNGFLHHGIHEFKKKFFEIEHLQRTTKHIADPLKNSAAKRFHLFLKWMVRQDNGGVDIGIWKSIPTSVLSCPLDVHTGRVGRKLGFITIKNDNLKALTQLDQALRLFDANDPAKYDVALFGLGKEGFAS
ncbi:TIGR02757 family protein [Flavobacterium noncentrifugens]|uniref:TIGR02757 family protein n=1 Tax=Flavobacterium noncentrifugens TaxID=1128970 RepID=A0A1G8YH21_9FLAO|nr:TIGR02757 family protein [Flavobacterium noncentrifugens]GEP51209.1 TIGR02757 family protein [Flavobacterium noncentrifugens]SDK01704.1 TIGR02757 family protein [Flavobacterium noncentrifugens]